MANVKKVGETWSITEKVEIVMKDYSLILRHHFLKENASKVVDWYELSIEKDLCKRMVWDNDGKPNKNEALRAFNYYFNLLPETLTDPNKLEDYLVLKQS